MSGHLPPVIELDSVEFSWKEGIPVLDIPELKLYPQEKIFIRGPSGSGKTTLLGLLGGVITPQQGTVNVLGQDLAAMSAAQRDHFRADQIGFVFQLFNLIPYLSVIENVVLPLGFAPRRQQKVSESGRTNQQEALRLLQHLGLDDPQLLQRPVTELSIGQQQRVAAARALIGSPGLVIADEPTSALDSNLRTAFIQLLFDECQATGSTLVFVSHDMALESQFDRSIDLQQLNLAGEVA
ncbi:ABC transporter ATP-binding protein [Spongorhabdus nitratireducens]